MKDVMRTKLSIPAVLYAALEEAIANSNKKALRLGVREATITVLGSFEQDVLKGGKRTGEKRPMLTVAVEGQTPMLCGWEFEAVVEPVDGTYSNAVIRKSPRTTLSEEYLLSLKDQQNECDHCHKNRYRKELYILRNTEDGRIVKVGKNCMKDFLGHKSPEKILAYYAFLFDTLSSFDNANEENFGGRAYFSIAELLKYVALTFVVVRQCDGKYLSTKNIGPSTSNLVYRAFTNPARFSNETGMSTQITSDDEARAEELIKWVRNVMPVDNSYAQNLKTFYENDFFKIEHGNMVVSAYAAYRRYIHQQKSAAPQKQEEEAVSEYVGRIGDHLETKAKLVFGTVLSGTFGDVYFYNFRDEKGNVLVLRASRPMGFEKDETYHIKGRIKNQGEYKGVKQTQISHVKVLS